MKLHDLKPAEGSRKVRNRVGRGIGSGNGKTSGKGHNGQNARSGGGVRPGFEGGQNPLYIRLPKRGFTNPTRKEFAIVNLNTLNRFDADTEVTPELLIETGVVKNAKNGIKILGNGQIEKSLTVKAHKFSASAVEAIEAAGGKNRGDLMFRTISNIIRVGDLRQKVLFTLLMLIVFRIGSFIPVPGSNKEVLNFFDEANAFGFLNTFGGGALGNFSIFAMGIMPYITASIVVQLLQMDVVPKFAEWAKQGEAGRRKLAQFTRYGTIVLGFFQALAMSIGFNTLFDGLISNPSVTTYLFIALVLTAGTAFLMWLGEQITAKGVGNGISIIIFAGIAAGIPNGVNQIYAMQIETAGEQLFLSIITVLLLGLAVLAIIVGVIFIQQALRKVPVQYAKRLVGQNPVGGQSTHLPIKVNAAGVIPVIFASALFYFPPTIAGFLGNDNIVASWINKYFVITNTVGMIAFAILIIAFTYFYTFIQVNPEQMAENLKKQGGYIPGIRPGHSTQVYLTRILYRLTFVGALFLASVSIIPVFFTRLMDLPPAVQIGGTGLLIVVGVALDTMKQIESQLIKRSYKGFIK